MRVNGVDKGRIDSDGSDIPIVNTTVDNTAIGSTTPSTGAFTAIEISTQPSLPANATRKDYVDNRISAFAIAFGV